MDPRARHWIAGRPAASASGTTFDARAPAAGGSGPLVGRWPRAAAADVRAAREAAVAAAPSWRALSAGERQECLTEALQAVRSAAAPELEALSGLPAARRARSLDEALPRLAEHALRAAQRVPSNPLDELRSVPLVAPHWSEGTEGLLLELLGPLAAGRPAIAAPDARLCALGDALLPFAARLPAGVVGVLHGLDPGLAPPGAWQAGPAGRARVCEGSDLESLAARVVHAVHDAQLGACGWRAGAPRILVVDDRVHGRFVELLLEAFEVHPDRLAPFGLAAAEARSWSSALAAAASEEGACIVPPRNGSHGRLVLNLAGEGRLSAAAAAGPGLVVLRALRRP